MSVWLKLLKFIKDKAPNLGPTAAMWGSIIFASYLLSSTLSSSLILLIGEQTLEYVRKPILPQSNPVSVRKNINFVTLRKNVEKRNLFNSEGEFPEETDPNLDQQDPEAKKSDFDEQAKCPDKSTLPLELFGTIAMGPRSPSSLATVFDKEFRLTDFYKVGDAIIGHEQASIYSIHWRKVVINNQGKKECLVLNEDTKLLSKISSSSTDNKSNGANVGPGDNGPVAEGDSSTITLENAYVTDALADGFAKVLNSGRLVPYNRDNKLIGFKLIGVKNNSLFTKIGLRTGDVLTNVNGTSMAQAEQGFALLSALAEEKEVRVQYLRGGKTPMTVTIEIK